MLGFWQGLEIPSSLKTLYKTVWEIKQRILVDMAAGRGAFIDQSQSFNVHLADPNYGKLTSLHFYAWKVRQCFFTLHISDVQWMSWLACAAPAVVGLVLL